MRGLRLTLSLRLLVADKFLDLGNSHIIIGLLIACVYTIESIAVVGSMRRLMEAHGETPRGKARASRPHRREVRTSRRLEPSPRKASQQRDHQHVFRYWIVPFFVIKLDTIASRLLVPFRLLTAC